MPSPADPCSRVLQVNAPGSQFQAPTSQTVHLPIRSPSSPPLPTASPGSASLYQHQTTTTMRKFWTSALLHPESLRTTTCCCTVVAPQPVRPIGPSISVGCISEDPSSSSCAIRALKRPEEVEKEVESEALPAIISDSNRVRLANSAYMEMIGQPECSWLDATYDAWPRSCACKRINGEAKLQLPQTGVPPVSNGFTCRVRIEWGSDGKKSRIYAPCNVIRLSCISKEHLFSWRFHTREASED